MEDKVNMLELMLRPAFCVHKGQISQVNREASRYLLAVGTPILDLLLTGQEEYAALEEGCLCLTLRIEDHEFAASAIKQGDHSIFVLEQDAIHAHLQSLALVAQEMREPLAGMMSAADRMQSAAPNEDMAQMNRRLYQMLRLVGNMSDAARFTTQKAPAEWVDIDALLREIFAKAIPLSAQSGKTLCYTGLQEHIYTLANDQLIERAVYNLISNAMKYSPKGSTIEAKLVKSGRFLRFTVEDPGCGISADIQGNLFSRYMRNPGLEDPTHGLGLGLLLVRLAASTHGGTVLIDHPHENGTRVTMTLAICQESHATVRSPRLRIDYAGERDHALVELSDVLDASVYQNI